jgi:hypothetical protein
MDSGESMDTDPIDPLWQPSMTSGLIYGVFGIVGSAIALAILVPHLIDSTISDEADSDDRDTGSGTPLGLP